jgi:hypothetical protein
MFSRYPRSDPEFFRDERGLACPATINSDFAGGENRISLAGSRVAELLIGVSREPYWTTLFVSLNLNTLANCTKLEVPLNKSGTFFITKQEHDFS